MKAPKVVLGFGGLSDPAFESKALAILAAMTGNPNFPSPTPTIADLTTAVQQYSDALSAAQTRDKVKVATKNSTRDQLKILLRNLSYNVNLTANGDVAKLTSSGFNMGSQQNNSQIMTGAENFKVELGKNSGEAVSSVNGMRAAKTYVSQYTFFPVTADSKWESVFSSTSSITITGLEPLKQYCFRMIITGSRNQSVQTDVITKTIV